MSSGASSPDTAPDTNSDACAIIEGRSYSSVEEHECGLGPNGVEMCHWTIRFAGGNFQWRYSDIGESGTYSCDGYRITSTGSARAYTGELDLQSGILTWEGIAYAPSN